LGSMLDLYPNLFVDISARDYEVGRQPRAAASFLTKYADRVLFGTDMGMDREMYQSWWRLLESADEHMVGRVWWRYYGLAIPDQVLEALYHTYAKRILNWRTNKSCRVIIRLHEPRGECGKKKKVVKEDRVTYDYINRYDSMSFDCE